MDPKPFFAKPGGTILIANAVVSAAGVILEESCEQVALYNSSATAISFVRISALSLPTDTIPAATLTADMPVPPGAQIRVSCAAGFKGIRAIASAADGNLYVTPGNGN
jgi:hypothetical protein